MAFDELSTREFRVVAERIYARAYPGVSTFPILVIIALVQLAISILWYCREERVIAILQRCEERPRGLAATAARTYFWARMPANTDVGVLFPAAVAEWTAELAKPGRFSQLKGLAVALRAAGR